MYPLWKMCECVSEKGVETWNEIKIFVELYKIDEKEAERHADVQEAL